MAELPRRKLGTQGLEVSSLGLGCNMLGELPDLAIGAPAQLDTVDFILQAFDNGITFFDTSDVYGPQHNSEIALGDALRFLPRHKVQVATKFGLLRENGQFSIRGDPDHVRKACEASLERLGVDYIDLYYPHRVGTKVPIEDTMGALKKLVEEGKIKYIGLSETHADTIRRAHAVHPISAVQMEWSLWTREIEDEIVPLCRKLGIGIVPYCPLGFGFFSGKGTLQRVDYQDHRIRLKPRFLPGNLEHNRVLYNRVAVLAQKHGCTSSQLAISWLLHQGEDVVPIPGTTKIQNLKENKGAVKLKLTPHEVEEVAAAVPQTDVVGGRVTDDLPPHQ